MAIYFDEKKQAYSFEIDNAVAMVDDETWTKYSGTDKWDIVNGKFTDITDTDEYKAKAAKQDAKVKQLTIFDKIKELDEKRIRAIAEPELKDSSTGETWLNFYNAQIADLRKQLSELTV